MPQVHTGFGDNDLRLELANPLHFVDVIREAEAAAVPVVLLHGGYPYSREASFLCAQWACVHLDISLAVPLLSRAGMADTVAQCLSLAPLNKVMLSSDAHTLPEMYFLSLTLGRQTLSQVLAGMLACGDLDAAQALRAASDIARGNASRLYRVLEDAPAPSEARVAALEAAAAATAGAPAAPGAPALPPAHRGPPRRAGLRVDPDARLGSSGDVGAARDFFGAHPGVKLVRLLWGDSGGLRRCRVMPVGEFLRTGVRHGVGLTEACMAMPFLSDSAVPGAGLSAVGEVRLVPDVRTLVPLPWYPGGSQAAVLCDMYRGGAPWACCPRSALKAAARALRDSHGLSLDVGAEVEFQLLRPARPGSPGTPPRAASPDPDAPAAPGPQPWRAVDHEPYCSSRAAELSSGFLDALVESLAQLGVPVHQVHAESAPGQFEASLGVLDPVAAADALILTREAVVGCAAAAGMNASFLPKTAEGAAGNAVHAHLSLRCAEGSVMAGEGPRTVSAEASAFFAGVLAHLPALPLFTAPSASSMHRVRPGAWAGAYQMWGWLNKEAPLRACVFEGGDDDTLRDFEYKLMDATGNPHLALAALAACGMSGLRAGLALPDPVATDPSALTEGEAAARGLVPLPRSVGELRAAVDASPLSATAGPGLAQNPLARVMPPPLLVAYLAVKRAEWSALADVSVDEMFSRFGMAF